MNREMPSEWKDYLELTNERPELFAHSDLLDIVFDEETVADFCERTGKRIGLLYRSRYNMLIVDLVRAPFEGLFAYERFVPVQPKNAVVTIPYCRGRFVLLDQFRHPIRKAQYAFPRGFGEPDLTVEENAAKELAEEIGAKVLSSVVIGKTAADSGVLGGEVNVVFCNIDGAELKEGYEGIRDMVMLDERELAEWIESGRIDDGFTLSAMALLWACEKSGMPNK